MVERSGRLGWFAAGVAFVFSATLFLWIGRAFRYAVLHPEPIVRWLLFLPAVIVGGLLYEKLFRGLLYDALQRRLPVGFAAPAVAAISALAAVGLRFSVLPLPHRAPVAVVLSQAYLVETLLALALAWIALGTGSIVPGGLALAALWLLRICLVVTYRGGVLPFLEVLAALATPLIVALVLKRELAPHRDAVMEA